MSREIETFDTYQEYQEHFFPEECEKERISKMTPYEYGQYLARKMLENLKAKGIEVG